MEKSNETKNTIVDEILRVFGKTGKIKETAEKVGCSWNRVIKVLSSNGVLVNDLHAKILDLHKDGKTPEEIAEITQKNIKTIQAYLPATRPYYNVNESDNAIRIKRHRGQIQTGRAEDLTEQVFGYLKVLGRAVDKATPSGQKRTVWRCKCLLCGRKKDVPAQDLKRGNTKSCGCLAAAKGKAARNVKICVECGKPFECPPSDETATCSQECRRLHARNRQIGVKRSTETREKISTAAKGRDMSDFQLIGTTAAKESPKSGKFVTNVNAIDWHLVSPDGNHYLFHSLNFWLRENCMELFGCEPDSKEYINAASGLRNAKRSMLGRTSKGQRPCCTYKGWQVLPTDSDLDIK